MTDFDENIRKNEPDKRAKVYVWQTAIGLQVVDGVDALENISFLTLSIRCQAPTFLSKIPADLKRVECS